MPNEKSIISTGSLHSATRVSSLIKSIIFPSTFVTLVGKKTATTACPAVIGSGVVTNGGIARKCPVFVAGLNCHHIFSLSTCQLAYSFTLIIKVLP